MALMEYEPRSIKASKEKSTAGMKMWENEHENANKYCARDRLEGFGILDHLYTKEDHLYRVVW